MPAKKKGGVTGEGYMPLEIGNSYSRAEVFGRLTGNPYIKGNRSIGVVREGQFLLAFANIGVPGRTGHDFPNTYDPDDKKMRWYGQPHAHSGQELMAAIISGTLRLLVFTRTENKADWTFRGQAQVDGYRDGVEVVIKGENQPTIEFDLSFGASSDLLDAADFEGPDDINGRKQKSRGQGSGLNAEERKAVEMRAMLLAQQHLERQGYRVTDVSLDRRSFDLLASRDGMDLYVEVKGTTGSGDAVIMTGNEVQLLRLKHPETALIVVADIVLEKTMVPPAASSGRLTDYRAINLDDNMLTATEYRVSLTRI